LDPADLCIRLGATERKATNAPIKLCPLDQLESVWRAFGDTSVLYASPIDREGRKTCEGTLGEHFDSVAESYKQLSEEQQRLTATNWDGGPRLVRGVAGSGKTIVLANNLARRVSRMLAQSIQGLFETTPLPSKVLAVCFNRSLAPLIRRKIDIAFQQRTGRELPDGMVDVLSFNSLMWRLTNQRLWHYRNVSDANEIVRALDYLGQLEDFRKRDPQRLQSLSYDAIYVDEGQDFAEEEFRLLAELCRRAKPEEEPNLFVFYDDAQNLYGRGRPNWASIGLNIRGSRSAVMTQCYRNTRPIVEASFNVLYGTCADERVPKPTREYGDLGGLEQKGLIVDDSGFWRVRFAPRDGPAPLLHLAADARDESNC
jgi:superfamily I DNA and RNA helicase